MLLLELLETKNINISFSGIQILNNVNFTLKEKEILCLCGENGAGKSTFIKILTGIYPFYTGNITLQGHHVDIGNPRTARELGIFAVHQHRDLVPTMNTYENIFLANARYLTKNRKQRLDFKVMRQESLDLISKFGISLDIEKPVSQLKVSEQGIVAICKALAAQGRILLIDEASAPLDSAERQVLYETLFKLRNDGKGIVYITHHLDEVFHIGDRITVFRNGEHITTAPVKNFDKELLIQTMIGNVKVYDKRDYVKIVRSKEVPVVEFEKVSTDNLKDISFQAYKGEIVGFAGLEGSFKTDIANVCFGLEKSRKGSIRFKGREIISKHPIHSIKKGIGLVPADRKNAGLINCRSVSENIILTKINKNPMIMLNPKWIRNTAINNIKKFGIKTSGQHQLVDYLSGGNQQKVLISKWLEADQDVLFMVEPTEGIDVGTRAELYDIFKNIVFEGKTILLFTSDIDELMTLCDRVYTMVKGKIINEFKIAQTDKNEILTTILSRID